MLRPSTLQSKLGVLSEVQHVLTNLIQALLLAAFMLSTATVLCAQDTVTPGNSDSNPPAPKGMSVTPTKLMAEAYIISPDDVLDISVFDVPELSRTYRVSPTGTIDVPLLPNAVNAAGKSPTQLSKNLANQLREAGMVSHAQVTIQVKESRAHSIAIAGAVRKPMVYSVMGKTTLLDALSQAEGLADDAGKTAIITRGDISSHLLRLDTPIKSNGGDSLTNPRTMMVDLKRLVEDGDASLNCDLYPGDSVTVQRAGIVYVVGAVNRAGGFVLKNDREQMTVLKALALAEYVKSTADTKKTVIIRGGPKEPGGAQEIPIQLDKMLKGRIKDRVLLANDILFIPDSAAKRAIHRAGEAAAQAASLLVYRY